MSKQMSWQDIAHQLGARMAHNNYCANDHEGLEVDCPYCDDRRAYLAYIEKCWQAGVSPHMISSLDNSPVRVRLEDIEVGDPRE